MATALLPFSEWVAGTLQNSVPANDNALRSEVLSVNVISDATTAQPGSPADGDCYIVPAGATGAQWATFAAGSLAYFRAGTWYEFTAYEGLLKVVAGEIKLYNGSSWEVYGGSNLPLSVEEGGVEVSADVATINFTGSGVSVTETSPGVVEVEISSGGFANPMTSAGDLIVGGTGGAAQRLGIGASGQVLRVVSGAPQWSDESGGGGGSLPVFFDGALIPQGFTAGFFSIGHSSPSFTGSSGGGSFNASSPVLRYPHRSATAVAATNAIAGIRQSDGTKFVCRNAGFYFCSAVCPSNGAATASHRLFCGLIDSTTAPTDVNPSTLTNFVALGYDSGDSQVQIMHNDGSGTATKIALGSSFPKPTADDSAWYFLELRCEKEGSSIDYRVVNPISGAEASGIISTDMPSLTTSMNFYQWMSAGGTSTGISLRMGTLRLRI